MLLPLFWYKILTCMTVSRLTVKEGLTYIESNIQYGMELEQEMGGSIGNSQDYSMKRCVHTAIDLTGMCAIQTVYSHGRHSILAKQFHSRLVHRPLHGLLPLAV